MNSNAPGHAGLKATLPADEWFTARRFAVLLALMIVALFPEVIFGDRTFVYRDFGLFGYPLAYYHRACFWRGEIPLWNPLSCSGIPFFAQWITLVSYPLSLFYLLFPLAWSLAVFCLLHLFLAGTAMYLLAYRWTNSPFASAVAGLAFAFNGLTLNSLMWPNIIAALAWMPLVVLVVERAWREGGKRLFIAALVGAMQMLTGAPEIILLTWTILLALAAGQWMKEKTLRHRLLLRLVSVVLLVSALAAVQLLPFLDLLKYSERGVRFGDADWSMPLTGWANLFVPLFRCHQATTGVYFQAHQGWTSSYYLGIAVLALGVLAVWKTRDWRLRLLAASTLLGLVLALGDDGLLLAGIRRLVPQIGFMRFPIKFVVIAVFTVPLLAAFGIQRFFSGTVETSGENGRAVKRIGLLFSGIIVALVTISFFHPEKDEKWAVTFGSGLSRLAFLILILGVCQFADRIAPPRRQLVAQLSLLLLLLLDVVTHTPWQNPTAHRSVYEPRLPEFQMLVPQPALGASRAALSFEAMDSFHQKMVADPQQDFLARRLLLSQNFNLFENIPKVDGFYSLYLREEREVHYRLYTSSNSLQPHLADFLGISQVTAPGKLFEWQARPTYLPMITAGQQPRCVDDQTSLRGLLARDFDPRQTVYLPLEAQTLVKAGRSSSVKILSQQLFAPRIEVELETQEPTMMVVAQTHYHWWKAYVDGGRVPLWRANHAFQALAVPAGRHRVNLVYEDDSFRLGAIISSSALALCFGAWWGFRKAEVKP